MEGFRRDNHIYAYICNINYIFTMNVTIPDSYKVTYRYHTCKYIASYIVCIYGYSKNKACIAIYILQQSTGYI